MTRVRKALSLFLVKYKYHTHLIEFKSQSNLLFSEKIEALTSPNPNHVSAKFGGLKEEFDKFPKDHRS